MPLIENVPTAQIDLDRPRSVAFTIGTMRRFKELAGYSVTVGVEPEDIGRLLWASLVDEDRSDLSPEQVDDLVHPGNLEAIGEMLSGLQGQSTTEAKGAEGKPRKTQAKK